MARRVYPRRYAQAVFEIARESNELDRWQSDLTGIVRLTEDAEVVGLLQNPKVRFEDRARLLKEHLPDVNPLAFNLVYLLIERDRLGLAGQIAAEYHRLLDSYRGVAHAEVTTAVPVEENVKNNVQSGLKTLTGKDIVLQAEVDPGLIGGVVVRVGGKLIDGSTRSRLQALKKELAGAGVKSEVLK